ncbi:hypothetical protein [Acidaminococcus intestini]|uniref:hypothetical protein n=1 Tax=Acidaminococcus intestini TaxID=187327 RepID=UPI002659E9F2|nr:hypothetical protein [uncultured Dialister sp.]
MKWWRKGIVCLLACLAMMGFSSAAMAEYDPTPRILSKLQGQWYDQEGNVVLDFQGNTVNGCAIVGVYHLAGADTDFSGIIRIVEAEGYRDMPVICENMYSASYHSHIILNGDNHDLSKGTLLMRTTEPRYYESVGGIGLDMTEDTVRAKYGSPDRMKQMKGSTVWTYQKLGLDLTMCQQRVCNIKIYQYGDRHFDRTGFNCANLPYEFQSAYGFQTVPKPGQYGAFGIGHGEYLWFNDYPNSISLNMCWN